MYAVIEVGTKQYTVSKNDTIEVEKINDLPGDSITIDKVLLVSDDKQVTIGQPYIKNAKVELEVVRSLKGPKVLSFKYRRRKSSHWRKGHRQQLVALKITSINAG